MASTSSSQGAPGLVAIPSASAMPVGTARIGLNSWPNVGVFRRRGDVDQWNFHFTIGLASRLVIGGRGTEVRAAESDRRLARDLAANVHLLLAREGRLTPAVAVGVHDAAGAAVNLRGRYLVASKTLRHPVASKTLRPWARITAGYGIGPDILDGLFGGIELAPLPWVHLLADYDANRVSAGLRLFPVPERLVASGVPGLSGDLLWSAEAGVSWGFTLSTAIDPVRKVADRRHRQRPPPARTPDGSAESTSGRAADKSEGDHRSSASSTPMDHHPSAQRVIDRVQTDLIEIGLENVRVSCSEDCGYAVVEAENGRYNRDDFDAVARIFGILAHALPPEADSAGVVLLKRGLPVMNVTVEAGELPELAVRSFIQTTDRAGRLRFSASRAAAVTTGTAHRSRGKLDVVAAPGLETVLYSEIGIAMARLYALPEAYVHVLPGVVLSAGATLPITETPDFPGFMPVRHIHRALAHVALPIPPVRPGMKGVSQFSAGRFSEYFYGWLNETIITGWRGRMLFGLKAGVQRFSLSKRDRLFAVGRVRFYLPSVNARLIVKAGQFFDRDRGYGVDASRFFGDTEIGLFLRHTDAGALAGIRIAVPLSPIKDMRPYPVRIRPPSVWHYEQRSLVFEERNRLVSDIAREVYSGHAVQDVYFNRDRMSESYFFEYFSP